MGANTLSTARVQGVELVRDHLLTSIHLGRLRPGDRVLSVRRLAEMTGVNPKTVHRAYKGLEVEGILETRPGSGTYVRSRCGALAEASLPDLVATLERIRGEATRLGVSPDQLSEFLATCFSDGLRGVRLALVECNWEQIAMIGRDVHTSLGVRTTPIRLDALSRNPATALGMIDTVLTTDCHYAEVMRLVEPLGVAVHTVTLDACFPQRILAAAKRADVLMVIRDERFAKSFRPLLERVGADGHVPLRIDFVTERDALRALGHARPGTQVWFSPLLRASIVRALPVHARHLEFCWHVERTALEMLRASLGIERALVARPD